MRRVLLVALVAMTIVTRTAASPIVMVCKNFHREYVVRFDEAERTFIATAVGESGDEGRYLVLAIENSQNRFWVVGLTNNGGPPFRAQFRPNRKMEFFEGGKLEQTDTCR